MKKAAPDPVNSGTLAWHHTELGRRTDCESYRAIRMGPEYWRLLDREWNPIGGLVRTLVEAQARAERHKQQQKVA